MSYLICVSTRQELSALMPSFFPKPEKIPELHPIAAKLKNSDCHFLVTGTGPINAALGTGYSIAHIKAAESALNGVISIGLASSFNLEQAPLTSIWTINKEIWPEYGLNDGARITAKAFSVPLWNKTNNDLIYDEISLSTLDELEISQTAKACLWPVCSAITVSGVTASFNRRDYLWDRYHALLENMEGFAIGYAALRYGIPCAEIRIVSQKCGPRSREEKDQEGALNEMARILPELNLA